MIKRKISQEDTGDINVQGLVDATTDENVEDDEIQRDDREFNMQGNSGGDVNIKEVNNISEDDRRIITETLEFSKSGGNNLVNFKRENQRQLEEITNRVTKVKDKIPARTITETNNLINAASI